MFGTIIRAFALGGVLLTMAACSQPFDEDAVAPELADFRLGFAAVDANNTAIGPLSREATPEEWKQVFEAEIAKQLGFYSGTNFYHLSVSINGYTLAGPGIPIVAAPKSVLIFSVTLWDDATSAKLNEKPERFTVFESASGEMLLGTGFTRSKEEQMDALAKNATRALRDWLAKRPELQTANGVEITDLQEPVLVE